MLDAFAIKSTQPEVVATIVRLQGAGAADPTKEEGVGITATRTGTGVYRLTWTENPGRFLGACFTFGAATPADIAGHTAARDTWDSANFRLDFTVFNNADAGTGAAPAATDLATDEYVDVLVFHARTSV